LVRPIVGVIQQSLSGSNTGLEVWILVAPLRHCLVIAANISWRGVEGSWPATAREAVGLPCSYCCMRPIIVGARRGPRGIRSVGAEVRCRLQPKPMVSRGTGQSPRAA